MKKILFHIFLAAGLTGCIYPYTPDLEETASETIVVDGKILIGGTSTIQLSYVTPLEGQVGYYAWPRGKAWIEDEQGNRYGSTNVGSYTLSIDTRDAPMGRNYRAVVEADGETYTSDWLTPDPAPTITNISFVADDNNVVVYVDLDAGLGGSGYIGFTYEETWEFHSDFYPEWDVNPGSWTYINLMESQFEYPYYWCWRSMNSPQMVLLDYSGFQGSEVRRFPLKTFSRTNSRNHKRYSINVRAFALSKDAYLYNKTLQEISEIGGDLFSPDPGAMPSNLTCESNPEKKVMGMVLAGNVVTQRAFMYNQYLISIPAYYDFVKVEKDEMPIYYNNMNFRPVKEVHNEENGSFIGWAPHRCINCIEAGGTQERPDFWED